MRDVLPFYLQARWLSLSADDRAHKTLDPLPAARRQTGPGSRQHDLGPVAAPALVACAVGLLVLWFALL